VTINLYEQRPPTVRAVRFDGENAAEVAELLELDEAPEVLSDDAGAYIAHDLTGWGEEYTTRVGVGDYVVRFGYGGAMAYDAAAFTAQYRVST